MAIFVYYSMINMHNYQYININIKYYLLQHRDQRNAVVQGDGELMGGWREDPKQAEAARNPGDAKPEWQDKLKELQARAGKDPSDRKGSIIGGLHRALKPCNFG